MEMYLVKNNNNKKELFFNPKEDRLIKGNTKEEIETIPVNIDDFSIDNLCELKSDIEDYIHKTGKHIHHSLTDIEKANGEINESSKNIFALGEPLDDNPNRHLIIEIDENTGVQLKENNSIHIDIKDMSLDETVKIKDEIEKYSMMCDIVSENIK